MAAKRERERDEKLTSEQKMLMVNFMEDHSDFAQNKFLGPEGKKKNLAMWEILTTQLNNTPGPEKGVVKWQKAWTSMKNKVKRKAGMIHSHRGATGGGGPINVVLTELEEKIISIIGPEATYGIDGPDGVPTDSMPELTYAVATQIGDLAEASSSAAICDMEPESAYAVEMSSGENTPDLSEGISSGPETDSENTPTPKRRRKQQKPAEPTLNQFLEINHDLHTTLQELVSEVQQSRREAGRTNELLGDIAESLRHLSGRQT